MSDQHINQRLNIIPADQLADRLERMEEKIDKLSDAMILLARTEEKMLAIEASVASNNSRLDRHSQKLNELTMKAVSYERLSATVSKAFWLVVTAGITVLITVLTGVQL